jgi:8-oxo-dGTP pyrophosphatase MutT (NUDIX family)
MNSRAPVRPVDAAGLILLRGQRDAPEILLGRRHARSAFLPDIYVVPGGRVDPQDHLPSGFDERLHPIVDEALSTGGSRRPSIAFLRAALRELHEETGLIIGKRGTGTGAAQAVWQAYAGARIAPDFGAFDFLLRAITPAQSRRRYNTRFFLGDGRHAVGNLRGDGELLDLGWRKAADLERLNIVDVTWALIRLALERWRARTPVGGEPPKLLTYRSNLLVLRPMKQPGMRRRP